MTVFFNSAPRNWQSVVFKRITVIFTPTLGTTINLWEMTMKLITTAKLTGAVVAALLGVSALAMHGAPSHANFNGQGRAGDAASTASKVQVVTVSAKRMTPSEKASYDLSHAATKA